MWQRLAILVYLALPTSAAVGEILYDPALNVGANQSAAGISFTKSKVEMEAKSVSIDVERTYLGFDIRHGIDSELSVIGQFGLGNKVEYEDDDGDGYLFGFGASMDVYKSAPTRVAVHGVMNYLKEEIEDDPSGVEVDASLLELHMGVVAIRSLKRDFEAYAGLDLIPYSDGDLEAKGYEDVSIERDDLFNLRLGGHFIPTPTTTIHLGVALISETTLNLGASFKF